MDATLAVDCFAELVGADYVRPACPSDAIDGVVPTCVVEPSGVEEVSEVLRAASERGLKVAPRGGGTQLTLGGPPESLDIVLSLARLDRLLDHAAGDLVAHVEAGMPMGRLAALLADAGQQLALDGGGTVGGVIAANTSGPRRLRNGMTRDLLIGITVVLADGTITKAGGRVVKNVAGYDLCKLYTGSLGTLGVIVEAVFRLHPLLEATRTVRIETTNPSKAGEVVQAILHSSLVLSSLELEAATSRDDSTLVAIFEGVEAGVEAQAATLVQLVGAHGRAEIVTEIADSAVEPERPVAPTTIKVSVGPAALPAVLRTAREATSLVGLDARVHGHAASGVTYVELPEADARAHADVVAALRRRLGSMGGSVVVVRAPLAVKQIADVWGEVGDALLLMRRVKARFDPARTLNPGRFVGGI